MSTSSETVGGVIELHSFTLEEMKFATDDFDETRIIGEGGFGKVYKGRIEATSQEVAIKELGHKSWQGDEHFRAEINVLSKFRHCHLVPLIGYCKEKEERMLVYKYIPGGSLFDHIKDKKPLPMMNVLKIITGSALGLGHLHTGLTEQAVIHHDVKCRNILLDEKLEPVISDLGMSTQLDADAVDDERKEDVIKLGVVMLELLSVIFADLVGTVCVEALQGFVKLAERCLDKVSSKRPTMAEIVVSSQALQKLQRKYDTSNAGGCFNDYLAEIVCKCIGLNIIAGSVTASENLPISLGTQVAKILCDVKCRKMVLHANLERVLSDLGVLIVCPTYKLYTAACDGFGPEHGFVFEDHNAITSHSCTQKTLIDMLEVVVSKLTMNPTLHLDGLPVKVILEEQNARRIIVKMQFAKRNIFSGLCDVHIHDVPKIVNDDISEINHLKKWLIESTGKEINKSSQEMVD